MFIIFFTVKVCEKRHIIREKKQQYVKREKEVLMLLCDNVKISAPFFVRLYCTFHDHNSLCKCLIFFNNYDLFSAIMWKCCFPDFVLTHATNGDLLTYLQKAEKFEVEVAQFYTAELVHAVEHMHMLGVIHRDLKPEVFFKKVHFVLLYLYNCSICLNKISEHFAYTWEAYSHYRFWFSKNHTPTTIFTRC